MSLTHGKRREMLLKVGLHLAKENGLFKVVNNDVAIRAKCSIPTVNMHFGRNRGLRKAIVNYARQNDPLWVNTTSIIEILND